MNRVEAAISTVRMTRRAAVLTGVAGLFTTVGVSTATAQKRDGRTPSPSAEHIVEAYRLGAGDKVKVTTFGEDSLTGEFSVSGAGMVALPLVGEVRAQGLTTTELQRAIEAALKDGYLKDPRVSVQVQYYVN